VVRALKPIALTFDDGPHAGTLEILRVLSAYQARATFFQCGMHARRNAEIARAVAETHEVANHTETHPLLLRCLPGTIAREVAEAQEAISRAAGAVPRLFRCPYGVPGLGLGRALRPHGLHNVFWTVIGNDWKWPAARIAERVLKATRPGGIIVLHDGRDVDPAPDISETVEAVRRIVPELLQRGYQFQTASELLCQKT
jgi:peptidoglycan/xylan/chitin deacetylase (PgdA/CDA1 family)